VTRGRLLVLAGAAAAAYVVAASAVAPGFFDGFAPPQPYAWVSPPTGIKNGGTPQPGSDQLLAKASYSGSVFTRDPQPQATISVIPGAFQAPAGGGPITVTITPAANHPDFKDLRCVTNAYRISATAPLVKDALVTLRFSDAVPAPSNIYRAPDSGGAWTSVGNIGATAPFYISARTTALGYFAACYPGDAAKTASGVHVGGSQTLPVLVALAILLVVLGGIPLALIRRRASEEGEEGGDGPGRDRGRED
jgi:hypothetical protein